MIAPKRRKAGICLAVSCCALAAIAVLAGVEPSISQSQRPASEAVAAGAGGGRFPAAARKIWSLLPDRQKAAIIRMLAIKQAGRSMTRSVLWSEGVPEEIIAFTMGTNNLRVTHGILAKLNEWPSTFQLLHHPRECTATAVGRNAVLTAAHCLDDEETGAAAGFAYAAIIVRSGSSVHEASTYDVTCTVNPEYRKNGGIDDAADIALCRTRDGKGIPDEGGPFETLVLQPQEVPQKPDQVRLLGYGCQRFGDDDFGILNYGDTIVGSSPPDSTVFMAAQGWKKDGPTVCYGDSGGAAYRVLDASGLKRRVFGVNIVISDSKTSLIASVYDSRFRKWAAEWAQCDQICGLTGSKDNCHS